MATSISGESKVLFGNPSHPWSPEDWTATDDRVRGGSSVSHMTCSPGRDAARFHGHLDTRTLGGAGFASQRTVDGLRWDLSGYDALVLRLLPGHEDQRSAVAEIGSGTKPRHYTVVLKDADALPKRPDGREQSTVSWEFDFEVEDQAVAAAGKEEEVVVMPFGEFKATYRGKPKEDAEPLYLSRVTRVSFMMRSFFDKQEGDFSLGLKSLSAVKDGSIRARTVAESVCTNNEKHGLDDKAAQKKEQEPTSWLDWLGSCVKRST